jgi:hypothetical protein
VDQFWGWISFESAARYLTDVVSEPLAELGLAAPDSLDA